MALKDIKVIELAGLAPAPFCGMVLADFGANIIVVDKVTSEMYLSSLRNGKKSISLDLKNPKAVNILRKMCKISDVLIEPFRAGTMETLGLGPNILLKDNPKLIYARLTGFGQSGPFSEKAGHDINCVALSGMLSLIGRKHENPIAPANLIADFGGGGLICALGILIALFERSKSGLGQVVDSNMVHGTAYLGSWVYRTLSLWGQGRGENVLDTGSHFYEVYKTKDGKYMSVGAVEPHFYSQLLKGLGINEEEAPQYCGSKKTEQLKQLFAAKFSEKTRDEWCDIFESLDACVAPVLSMEEASKHRHNVQQNIFVKTNDGPAPNPAPKLSRTPGVSNSRNEQPQHGQHTKDILRDLGFGDESIYQLEAEGAVKCYNQSKL